MAGRGWISWLATGLLKHVLQKHQKEHICPVRCFENKSCAGQYAKAAPQSISYLTSQSVSCISFVHVQSHRGPEPGPESLLLPAPSLGFVAVVTSSTCLFDIMCASSLCPLLPIQNTAAHDIHYLFQLLMLFTGLQYTQEKLVENMSQLTFFAIFSSPSRPQSGLGISSVARFVLLSELLLCLLWRFPSH